MPLAGREFTRQLPGGHDAGQRGDDAGRVVIVLGRTQVGPRRSGGPPSRETIPAYRADASAGAGSPSAAATPAAAPATVASAWASAVAASVVMAVAPARRSRGRASATTVATATTAAPTQTAEVMPVTNAVPLV